MTLAGLKTMIQNRRNRDSVYSSVKFWDDKAESYQGDAISMWANPHLNELYDSEQKIVLNKYLSHLEPECTILDLGCGTGRISRYLANRSFGLTGVDFSEATIDIARKFTNGKNPEFICASFNNLPTGKSYDAIVTIASLCLSCRNELELSCTINNAKAQLKKNGIFIIIEPIHRGFLHRVCNLNLDEFTGIIKNNGFAIEAVAELHFWPARLLLSYFPVPRVITKFVYRIGQVLLNGLFRNLSMGDYKAILAVRKD